MIPPPNHKPSMPGHNLPKNSALPKQQPPKYQPPHLHKESSFFDKHNRVYEGGYQGVEQTFKRDAKVREKMREIIRTGHPWKGVTEADIDKEIQHLEDRLDLNNDDAFTKAEVHWALRREEIRRKMDARNKNPFNPKDQHEIEKRNKEDEFLKEKFGAK